LAKNSIYPKLTITIDENTNLHRFILKKVNAYKLNMEILPNMEREKIIMLYSSSSALIYPSLFESFGLPLVEANQYGLPIIASELDYVRDILDPEETFDPNSAKSIYRSVKRFLKINNVKTNVIEPAEFIKSVISL
jgi:glycosyltransferase involved in cell wall biosynthesis